MDTPTHSPVRHARTPKGDVPPGMALCLSGGGYRAMLFHLGTLWRLNEAAFLPQLDRISSVSGGSITAGVLATAWSRLDVQDGVAQAFGRHVVTPLRRLASRTLDAGAVVAGIALPGTIGDQLTLAYDQHLFGGATLQDFPDDADGPRFVLNATNLKTGALWRFSKPYMGDYRVGLVPHPTASVARAVAASSAFPPVLSPVTLDLDPDAFSDDYKRGTEPDLTSGDYREQAVLADGGVYDNLGLETAWGRHRTILVSDAGGRVTSEPEPARDWVRQTARVLGLIDQQVRNLRERQIRDGFSRGDHDGAYWSIRSDVRELGVPDPIGYPAHRSQRLAETPTRLKRLASQVQERLINWGYAAADAAVRSRYGADIAPGALPYPDAER